MVVPLRDMKSEILLDYLDACFGFIDQGRKEGSALVYCFAAASRRSYDSLGLLVCILYVILNCQAVGVYTLLCMFLCGASIITAYLMRTERLSREDALESLRQSKPVKPNDGFLEQLKMFEETGHMVDRSSPISKRFRLKALGWAVFAFCDIVFGLLIFLVARLDWCNLLIFLCYCPCSLVGDKADYVFDDL
ncbi:hypothetical protein PTKIN_Ptkin09bG0286900 [Pterospermum kingtungense]